MIFDFFGIKNQPFGIITVKPINRARLHDLSRSYGYKMNAPRSGSSHYTFRKSGCQPITIPKHEPIKKVYVELVRQVVESEARNDEDAE